LEISKADWMAEGRKRFGDNTNAWKFQCPQCGRIQSYDIVRKEVESGTFKPKRNFQVDDRGAS